MFDTPEKQENNSEYLKKLWFKAYILATNRGLARKYAIIAANDAIEDYLNRFK